MAPVMLWGGDVNDDHAISIEDASLIAGHYGDSYDQADITQDGIVDILDLAILGGNYGKTSAADYDHWSPTP